MRAFSAALSVGASDGEMGREKQEVGGKVAGLSVVAASLQSSRGYERLDDSHHPGRGSERPGVTPEWLTHRSLSAGKVCSALRDCKVAPEVAEVGFWVVFFSFLVRKKNNFTSPSSFPERV